MHANCTRQENGQPSLQKLVVTKGIATSKGITTSSKKLLVTSALLVVTMFAIRNKCIATSSVSHRVSPASGVARSRSAGARGCGWISRARRRGRTRGPPRSAASVFSVQRARSPVRSFLLPVVRPGAPSSVLAPGVAWRAITRKTHETFKPEDVFPSIAPLNCTALTACRVDRWRETK